MTNPAPPAVRPANPRFSTGPTTKHPGWRLDGLADAFIGRSHRSAPGKAKLEELIDRSRSMLGLPDDYLLGILPASDTGAFEAALWSLLGARGVHVLAWESFGRLWADDITEHLKVPDTRILGADYGLLPSLGAVDFTRDVVFTWNGTTSGVMVPDGDWIPADRAGLTICDATSAVFGMDMPWDKLDATSYSWQKMMGGEAQHGMLVLSPRAVERLESHTPAWPMPKLFRLTRGGALDESIFRGSTINTPSMLCVEDALDGLAWAESIGGLDGLIARTKANHQAISEWVAGTGWVDFLCADPSVRSTSTSCLVFSDPWAQALPIPNRRALAKDITGHLASEGVAYDIGSHRDAPPGLRIWSGATVETADLHALFPWLDWAFALAKAQFSTTD